MCAQKAGPSAGNISNIQGKTQNAEVSMMDIKRALHLITYSQIICTYYDELCAQKIRRRKTSGRADHSPYGTGGTGVGQQRATRKLKQWRRHDILPPHESKQNMQGVLEGKNAESSPVHW